MQASNRQITSPQARGRELARQGRSLWQEIGTVQGAAAELMSRFRDLPAIQAFRYAAGLSQEQAATRYNEVTDHQTSLGSTTINAWESWARSRGIGSPPPFSSLLILALAYGRGPLGIGEERLAPSDLIADVYERLPPEDQIALKLYTAHQRESQAAPLASAPPSQQTGETVASGQTPALIGPDFDLIVPTVEYGNPQIHPFTLPNPQPGQLLDLPWEVFGHGIERLGRQIKNLGRRLEADICFGINEAGLVMATFLSSAQFGRCPIGYLKCVKSRDGITLDDASSYPAAPEMPTIVVCDFEVKHADVVGFIARDLRTRYPRASLYFAVFGAMTKDTDLKVDSFDDLTGAKIMRAADFEAVFIAATMSPPGIEPPLELR
ncbi:hypothetical protein [Actinospica robiniae]|uniref:hypothetical protein n=1 Tax=Actinospica robiniae TaxID=304901 RepID=UPI0005547F0F|nr:hypothetical protein [Actinospica robiniae]